MSLRRPRTAHRARDRRRSWAAAGGTVALETALVTPVVALLVSGVLGLTAVVVDQLAVERAARTTVRTVALTGGRGGLAQAVPAGTDVAVDRRGRDVTVVVTRRGSVLGLDYLVEGRATTTLEPIVP